MMLPDVFRRLKPLYGHKIDVLWLEYQTANMDRKQEIEGLLNLLAAKRLGMSVGEEKVVLEPPPAGIIGQGEYTIGSISYPGIAPYEFRLRRQELLRHLFILGPTGTGKSTLILGIVAQFLRDGTPFLVFDFKRNYRCLMPKSNQLLVITVGRDIAPLAVNALRPPKGVEKEEWAQALSDVIGNAYLLMQGAMNVLKEALLTAYDERGYEATLHDAHQIIKTELERLRPGSRRYGWLESTERSLDELTKSGFGKSLNAPNGTSLTAFLERPVVFELQGLGDHQKRFFCLYTLQYLLLLRKNESGLREEFRHVLVFDESHNVFPKDQYGEHSVPSRLAREVREYGEAIIAATQQADVSESLIANSGTKIILRTDYPKDVEFASRLLQVKPEWLSRLPLGTGIARLPARYYQPFLFTFPEQPYKNLIVEDTTVQERFDNSGILRPLSEQPVITKKKDPVTAQEHALLADIIAHPIAGITARYERLGWNPKIGNTIKDHIVEKGLAIFEEVSTRTGRIKILTLTDAGTHYIEEQGIRSPASRRGGAAHEYWRATMRTLFERYGHAVTEEYSIGGGRSVDLYAKKDAHETIIEIETGKSDIEANIKKCQGLAGRIVFFFATSELQKTWQPLLPPGTIAINPGTMADFTPILE